MISPDYEMDVDEALDRLYASPLEEFTATRNALAKDLGKDGAQVKSLKKPNLAAWALNQIPRRHPSELEELFEATQAVRLAQRRVLSGGKASALREATESRGRIVTKLTKLAGAILTEAGHAAAPTTLAAITNSFIAVAANEEGAEALRKGRLTRELHAESDATFTEGGGLTLIEGDAQPEAKEKEPSSTQVAQALRTEVNEARERAQAAKRAVREAETDVAKRVREADEADRAAKAAHESAEFARRAVDARRAEAEEAAKALEAAEKAFRDAD